MIFISVDLPAPFSPSPAWISPGLTLRFTPSLALTAGYCLLMPESSRRSGCVLMPCLLDSLAPPGRGAGVRDPLPAGEGMNSFPLVAAGSCDVRFHQVALVAERDPGEHLFVRVARQLHPALGDRADGPVPDADIGEPAGFEAADLGVEFERPCRGARRAVQRGP